MSTPLLFGGKAASLHRAATVIYVIPFQNLFFFFLKLRLILCCDSFWSMIDDIISLIGLLIDFPWDNCNFYLGTSCRSSY